MELQPCNENLLPFPPRFIDLLKIPSSELGDPPEQQQMALVGREVGNLHNPLLNLGRQKCLPLTEWQLRLFPTRIFTYICRLVKNGDRKFHYFNSKKYYNSIELEKYQLPLYYLIGTIDSGM